MLWLYALASVTALIAILLRSVGERSVASRDPSETDVEADLYKPRPERNDRGFTPGPAARDRVSEGRRRA